MSAKVYSFKASAEITRLFPKKYLGQHFLIDPNIKRKIIEACAFQPHETILEIGPGFGILTEAIAPHVKSIIAIETDKRLCEELKKKFTQSNVTILPADFLKYPLVSLPRHLKVIGNLPYYISTPIVERVIMNRDYFDSLYATLQYEFGQRLTAKTGSKEYGALSCFVQYHMDVTMLFKIKNTAFRPIPKVDSCFLKLARKAGGSPKANDEKLLFTIIHYAFQQRRKTIVNALSKLKTPHHLKRIFTTAGIPEKARAENLTLEDYVRVTNEWEKS